MKEEKKIYERECPNPYNNPNCKNIIVNKSKSRYLLGIKNNTKCTSCSKYNISIKIPNIVEYVCPNPTNYINCVGKILYSNKYLCSTAIKNNQLCRNCTTHNNFKIKNLHCIENLLVDSHEAFYWIGYLLADGHLSQNSLSFDTTNKDLMQLIKFANFIEYQNKIYTNKEKITKTATSIGKTIRVYDTENIIKIINKFDIHPQKTYNPPDINIYKKYNNELLKSLFIGFIDGDGCIHESKNKYKSLLLTINIHKNWTEFFNEMNIILFEGDFKLRITNNMVSISTWKIEILKHLKKHIQTFELPVLARKWDKIDMNKMTRYEELNAIKLQLFDEFKFDHVKPDLAKKYNIAIQTVHNYFKLFNNVT